MKLPLHIAHIASSPQTTHASRVGRVGAIFAVFALLLVSGCTHVAPYERGVLAGPTMTAGDLAGPTESHVRAVHEGAVGGGAAAEGGCGCN